METSGAHPLLVDIDAGRVRRALLLAVALLCVLSLLGQVSMYYLGHGHVFGLVRLFALDLERNVPTWFSSLCLFACAALLTAEAFGEDNFAYKQWTTGEEALEMLGIVVFLHALLEHIGSVTAGIHVRVAPGGG